MSNNKKLTLTKIFLIASIVALLLLLVIKIFAYQSEKEVNNTRKNINYQVLISKSELISKDENNSNEKIENFQKVIKVLYTFKENKTVAFQLRRKIEKQDLFDLIVNKNNFKEIIKNLNYDQFQRKIINELFPSEDYFAENVYEFYVYLIISQLDDNKISELKKQAEFIKNKIYKVDPKIIDQIKSSNDNNLNYLLKEIENNLYQNNLSLTELNSLKTQLNKINYFINIYESLKEDKAFIWIKENKENIISNLAMR